MAPQPMLPDPGLLMLPAAAILIPLELCIAYLKRRAGAELRDGVASLVMGVGNFAVTAATNGMVLLTWRWFSQFRLFDLGYAWWSFVLLLFADDLTFYWLHRVAHRVRFWWASHVVHHSSRHFNLSLNLRQSWTGRLTLSWLVYLPLILLGFPPLLVIFQAKVNLAYQFWLHAAAIPRLPRWLEAVMNTPAHHRVHHAYNPRYLDRNYAGIFIIWDKLFGTFAAEVESDPCRFGITENIATFNPLTIAFHEWMAIFRDLRRASSWRERLVYTFGVPGRSFDGRRQTADQIRARWLAGIAGTLPPVMERSR
jgi:sterol desaturase/sphingolipid hydroxylase (fatty acid hydroxylase superfamily)